MEQHKLPQEAVDYIKQHGSDSDDDIDFSDDPDGFTGPVFKGTVSEFLHHQRVRLQESSGHKTFKEFTKPE